MADEGARRLVPRGTDERLFRSLHRHIVDRDAAPPWEALDPSSLTDTVRERLRAAWSARVVAEYRSMIVFSEMLARLPDAGVSLEVSTALSRLIADEARHTDYCAKLAEALGGLGDATFSRDEARLPEDGLSSRLFLARWTLSMFCVGETASVGLLHALQDEARDPCVKAVLATLLRDESMHDRFGWALARTLFPSLTEDEREWLSVDLAFVFAHYDREHARRLSSAHDESAAGFGVVSPVRFAAAWSDRVHTVIVPGLTAMGLAAHEAWALRLETEGTTAPSAPR